LTLPLDKGDSGLFRIVDVSVEPQTFQEVVLAQIILSHGLLDHHSLLDYEIAAAFDQVAEPMGFAREVRQNPMKADNDKSARQRGAESRRAVYGPGKHRRQNETKNCVKRRFWERNRLSPSLTMIAQVYLQHSGPELRVAGRFWSYAAFLGQRIFCRDDCQFPVFATLGDELLGRILPAKKEAAPTSATSRLKFITQLSI
jgi:hypothetical protein